MLRCRACAKLNLTLEILGRRPDGYHEIASVMQLIDLCDVIYFRPSESLELECDWQALGGEDNLVLRAAQVLRRRTGVSLGARITLEKHIPEAAGLGGGSSDAAATLMGLNELWGLGLDAGELAEPAASLGSDVPFFLSSGTALSGGRGEVITPLPPLGAVWFVLARPPVRIEAKTATLYGRLSSSDYSDGRATMELARSIERGLEINFEALGNAFDRLLREGYPEVERAWSEMRAAGATVVHACGSGPSLYSPFRIEPEARAVAGRLAGADLEVFVVRTT